MTQLPLALPLASLAFISCISFEELLILPTLRRFHGSTSSVSLHPWPKPENSSLPSTSFLLFLFCPQRPPLLKTRSRES